MNQQNPNPNEDRTNPENQNPETVADTTPDLDDSGGVEQEFNEDAPTQVIGDDIPTLAYSQEPDSAIIGSDIPELDEDYDTPDPATSIYQSSQFPEPYDEDEAQDGEGADEEEGDEDDEPNYPLIVGIGILAVLLVAGLIFGLVKWNSSSEEKDSKIISMEEQNQDLAKDGAAAKRSAAAERKAAERERQAAAEQARKAKAAEQKRQAEAERAEAAERKAAESRRKAEEAERRAADQRRAAEAEKKREEDRKAAEAAAKVAIPDVIGMDREDAEEALREAGFTNFNWSLSENDEGEEVVQKVSPKVGKKVDKGSTINLS